MVLTPRGEALRLPVREVVERTQNLLLPPGPFDPSTLRRSFAIRASDALVGVVGAQLAKAVSVEAPLATIVFTGEGTDADADALRNGDIDLSINAQADQLPDITQRVLFDDGFVGVARKGHPLAKGRMTASRFAAADHAVTSRHGRAYGPIDAALADLGLSRHVAMVAPTYYAAAFAAAGSDLLATIPGRLARELTAHSPLTVFRIPLDVPDYTIVTAWHRRFDADPAHRWLRTLVSSVVAIAS